MKKKINLVMTDDNMIYAISDEDCKFLKPLEGKKFIVEDGSEVAFLLDDEEEVL